MNGQAIAITGAFGALGQAVARHLAAAGARLALIDRAEVPQALPAELQGALLVGGVDLTDGAATLAAFDRIRAHFQGLDGLVNVAGGFQWEPLEKGSIHTWDRMYALNLKTAVCATQSALPLLLARERSGVVCIGAGASAKATAGMGAYAASKAGVSRLTESLADELKDRGVRVNAVLPAIIDTPQNRRDMPDADFSRWVAPEQIASVIRFLLSNDASGLTGASIAVSHRC